MNINTEGSIKMELEGKTALSQETLREYVQAEVKVYTSLVDQHANKRGREHRNMWYYYMGRLNTCYQFLEYINHKTEP